MVNGRAAALKHFVNFDVERKTSYADIVRRAIAVRCACGQAMGWGERESIGAALDAAGFVLLDNLEASGKVKLRTWNQHSGARGEAIHTWTAALACEGTAKRGGVCLNDIRRAAVRRLSRAGSNYRKAQHNGGGQ